MKEPISMSGSQTYTYAKHPIIYEMSKLQLTGHEPQEYQLQIRFHYQFCIPEDEIKNLEAQTQLRDENSDRKPIPFILGTGQVIGEFVITQIEKQFVKFFPNSGRILEALLTVQMTEFF